MPEIPLRDAFGDFLVEKGKVNKNFVVLDADLSLSTRTFKFAKAYPERFFNMGVAEQNMVGTALGFAISKKIPIVSGFSAFTTGRAWEFIRFACHDNLNVKIITTHSGMVGEDGSTHNALEDLSLLAPLQNLRVLIPSDNIELIQILEYSLNNDGPFYIRLPRGSFPKIHDKDYKFSLGKPDVLKEGEDIGVIGTGYGSVLALHSAAKIEKLLNISLKIINYPSIKPMDDELLLKEIKSLKGIVVVEEHNIYCGFGSMIARKISKNFPIIMKFVGMDNSFGQSGNRDTLLEYYGINEENIKKKIQEIL